LRQAGLDAASNHKTQRRADIEENSTTLIGRALSNRAAVGYSNRPSDEALHIMTTSLYDFTVPMFTRALTNLSSQMEKASAFAEQRKFDSKLLAESRLIADMMPFSAQIQIACDNAKGAVARLAGIEPPKHEDTEKTLPELKARLAKTLDFIGGVKREQFVGADTRDIVLKFPQLTLRFKGLDYVTQFVLPNFYFHVTMAYALLRKNGVEIGKTDYLGAIQ
jgi:uncharacterized protein